LDASQFHLTPSRVVSAIQLAASPPIMTIDSVDSRTAMEVGALEGIAADADGGGLA